MRFTIKREELLKALNIASKAVASKSAIPVLINFKLELNEEGLVISFLITFLLLLFNFCEITLFGWSKFIFLK